MNPIRSLKSNDYFTEFLKERYQTIQTESRPNYINSPFEFPENPVYLTDLLQGGNSIILESVDQFLGISRLEPENPYVLHTSVPSARSIQSNLALLNIKSENQSHWFIYSKSEQEFVLILKEQTDRFYQEAELIYFIMYNHLAIGKYYGRFGFLLSLLDSGHQLNHFEHLFQACDLKNYKAEIFPSLVHSRITPFFDENYFPMVKMTCTGLKDVVLSDQEESGLRVQLVDSGLTKCTSYEQLVEHIFTDTTKLVRNELQVLPQMNYLSVIEKRTSLQSFEGLCFFEREKVPLESVVEKIKKVNSFHEVETMIFDVEKHVYFNVRHEKWENCPFESIEQLLHDSLEFIDVQSSSYVLVTALKKSAHLTVKEKLFSFIHSAEIMSEAALAFASNAYVSRCLRNIDDCTFLAQFPEYEEITYLQVIGKNEWNQKLYIA
ncbi:hypothetical protein [Enterococcus ureasiticus]|uniref:Uncharacterized protein n=1 Tax=Enterococcus ureasiticus TaxID=903984 RepID=A0A1E5G8G9_9ENTE|nr:hypothetical protein [Enterococcus ureasiticus]OEG09013.1 hypothetical protein BCR21_15675 [Enterococcus ureasiticus]